MSSDSARTRTLTRVLGLSPQSLPWALIGEFPTPITELESDATLPAGVGFVKRDDLSSDVYGGNKVRTLELLFGDALARQCRVVFATGAYGSNHAVATALHARRVGLSAQALLFPQPISWAALENLRVTLEVSDRLYALPHFSFLPFSMLRHAQRKDLGGVSVMAPGGATPRGALGYVSAALELAEQVEAGVLPPPQRIVVGIGSTCTTAGLLVGLALARQLGIGFRTTQPELVAVRVTPWPVTSRFRIVRLAERTARVVAQLAGDRALALSGRRLGERLSIDSRYLGRGYGRATAEGRAAMQRWALYGLPPLDTTYSAKAAAAFLADLERTKSPTLFWSTKSSAPLPPVSARAASQAPERVKRWIAKAERALGADLPASYQPLCS